MRAIIYSVGQVKFYKIIENVRRLIQWYGAYMYEVVSKNRMSWHTVWNHALRGGIIEWIITGTDNVALIRYSL
jgi:hypothetical protein